MTPIGARARAGGMGGTGDKGDRGDKGEGGRRSRSPIRPQTPLNVHLGNAPRDDFHHGFAAGWAACEETHRRVEAGGMWCSRCRWLERGDFYPSHRRIENDGERLCRGCIDRDWHNSAGTIDWTAPRGGGGEGRGGEPRPSETSASREYLRIIAELPKEPLR